jgi:four helix bundle protein
MGMGDGEWGMGEKQYIRPHYRLDAWKEAMSLVKMVYSVTERFPKEELYGLTNQIRRAAVSVPSNIAEGAARISKKEFVQFLSVARGSLSELETQLLISVDLNYVDSEHEVFDRLDHVSRLVTGLQRHNEP